MIPLLFQCLSPCENWKSFSNETQCLQTCVSTNNELCTKLNDKSLKIGVIKPYVTQENGVMRALHDRKYCFEQVRIIKVDNILKDKVKLKWLL